MNMSCLRSIGTRLWEISRKHPLDSIITILFAAAFILRFLWLDLMEFKGDEFTALILAYKQAHTAILLKVGLMSSVGLENPPFFIYLMAIPAIFSHSPLFLTYWIVFLNAIGIIFLFIFLRSTFSFRAALWTSALFTSAPWTFIYSRKIWAQNVLFPFLILIFCLITSLLQRYESWKVWALFFLVGILTQLHMSAWFLPCIIPLFFLIMRVRIRWKDICIGLLLFFVLYLPYILYHIETHFQNITQIFTTAHTENLSLLAHPLWSFVVTSGEKMDYLIGDRMSFLTSLPGITAAHGFFSLYIIIAFTGLLFFLGTLLFRTRCFLHAISLSLAEKMLVFFLLNFLIVHVFYQILHLHAFPHYHIIFYPIITLFFVLFLQRMPRIFHLPDWFPSILVLLIITANIHFTLAFLSVIKQHPQGNGDYGVPYRFTRTQWEEKIQKTIDESHTK